MSKFTAGLIGGILLRLEYNIADALVTNFHLPKTSLLIMVCAFAGYDLAMEAYRKAIKDKYRFFSYGDAMIVV